MEIAICNLCGVKVGLYRKVFRKNLGMGEWAPLLPSPIQCYPPHYFVGRVLGTWSRLGRGYAGGVALKWPTYANPFIGLSVIGEGFVMLLGGTTHLSVLVLSVFSSPFMSSLSSPI